MEFANTLGMDDHKAFTEGTHRLISPEETLERVEPHLATAGITRVANVTGLDHIGIPVALAIRPNSRSLSVSQGKGLTLQAAKVSAVMESLETWHAERHEIPILRAALAEFSRDERVIHLPSHVFKSSGESVGTTEFPWVKASNLIGGSDIWVPYDMVHVDFRAEIVESLSSQAFSAEFSCSGNGLASGNHILEATNHALSELIERDSDYRWRYGTKAHRRSTRLDLQTIDDPHCVWMIKRFITAGITVLVHDITSDVGVPAFRCTIGEDPKNSMNPSVFSVGAGCHPRREIALLRAVSEAAQARLTIISGSRDDTFRSAYPRWTGSVEMNQWWESISRPVGELRDFKDCPNFENDTFWGDVNTLLTQVKRVGITEVAVVDLTLPGVGIPVVKVVCPSLRNIHGSRRRKRQ